MNVKVIALDIDGTLTNDQRKITEATRKALLEAQEKGVRLVLASARPTPGLYQAAECLNMKAHGGILMAYNGGRIVEASVERCFLKSIWKKRKQKNCCVFWKHCQ